MCEEACAAQPVVSDNVAPLSPDKIKQFDAIQFACSDDVAPTAPR